jgi:hypothetical protein
MLENMKKYTVFTSLLFICLWLLFGAYLLGIYHPVWLSKDIESLVKPKSMAELGESFSTLGSLLSAIAVVIGLLAVLLQGSELRQTTVAQVEQSKALTHQLMQQEHSNRLSAYAARLQFLTSEMTRLETMIEKLLFEVEKLPGGETKSEKWDVIKNSRNLFTSYKNQAKEIDEQIQALLH